MIKPNDNYADLLEAYMADSPDDGFSDQVISTLQASQNKHARQKRICLNGAFLIGGVIASLQIPAIAGLIESADLTWASTPALYLPFAASFLIPCAIILIEELKFSV